MMDRMIKPIMIQSLSRIIVIESIYENNIKEYGKNACVLMRSGKG